MFTEQGGFSNDSQNFATQAKGDAKVRPKIWGLSHWRKTEKKTFYDVINVLMFIVSIWIYLRFRSFRPETAGIGWDKRVKRMYVI